jgi:hypothetical protein
MFCSVMLYGVSRRFEVATSGSYAPMSEIEV